LDGLGFLPTANYNGAATLTLTSNDLGNAGSGAALSDADTLALTVAAVNDAPVVNLPVPQSTNEEANLVFSAANGNRITLGDPDDADNGTLGDLSLRVTLSVVGGTLTLGGSAGLSFAGGANGSASMTVTGTLNNLNAALNGLIYAPAV